MTCVKIVAAVVVLSAMMSAQKIPPGTALPVTLSSDLNAKNIEPGQRIVANVAQNVPLPGGGRIRSGSRVEGRVLKADMNAENSSSLRIRFDVVRVNDRELPIAISLRALASPVEVQNAGLPIHGPVSAETDATWTTSQIGGDDVYRGGGHVVHGERVVGEPVADGVLAELIPVPPLGCAEGSGGRRLALWVFASSACGAYGFGKLTIEAAGDSNPMGDIVLRGKKNVHLPRGSAMLLMVTEAPQAQGGNQPRK
jgi:hypothetical protein